MRDSKTVIPISYRWPRPSIIYESHWCILAEDNAVANREKLGTLVADSANSLSQLDEIANHCIDAHGRDVRLNRYRSGEQKRAVVLKRGLSVALKGVKFRRLHSPSVRGRAGSARMMIDFLGSPQGEVSSAASNSIT